MNILQYKVSAALLNQVYSLTIRTLELRLSFILQQSFLYSSKKIKSLSAFFRYLLIDPALCLKKQVLPRHIYSSRFTLIEFIAVAVIISMVVGVVIGRVGKVPANLLIGQVAAHVEVLMRDASNRSVMQGKAVAVQFSPDHKLFSIDSKVDGYAERVVAEKSSKYLLPDDIEVEAAYDGEFQNDDGLVLFNFYPDGSGSGPSFFLKLKGHTRKLDISPLTGMVLISDEE